MGKKTKPNEYSVEGDYTIISIFDFDGNVKATTKVDTPDVATLRGFSWYVGTNGYIYTKVHRKMTYLHRFLIDAPKDLDVDHVNGNKQDNRKSNLRLATKRQNMYNSKKPRNNTSGIVGVSFHKASGKWRAYITGINGEHVSLGLFTEKDSAVLARKNAEIEFYGEFRKVGA